MHDPPSFMTSPHSIPLIKTNCGLTFELKSHLIKEHKKDEFNWMVEGIDSVFSCDECDIEFPQQSMLVSHKDNIHSTERENKTLTETKVDNAQDQGGKRSNYKCEMCNIKKKTESELRVHKSTMHNRIKRNLSEMKRGPISRTISVKRSPPMKKN